MSMPDLWSPAAMVPRERHVSRQFAVVPRERIYPGEKPAPMPHVVLAERREREVREAWRRGFKAAEDRYKISNCSVSPSKMRKIVEEVADKHGLTVDDIMCDRRGRKLVIARHEAMWRCFKETKASYPAIARILGDRDHTTIMHGVKRHEERMAKGAG